MNWIDERQWKPILAPLRSGEADRSAALLFRVISQFDVMNQVRYLSDDGTTWCNIFVWDVTSALNCEIPHWVDDFGYPAKSGPPSKEQSANATFDWLQTVGPRFGWKQVTELEARANAGVGKPSVASWKNPEKGHHGHIAMLMPPRDPESGHTFIAQAGRTNFGYGLLNIGFGTKPVLFFNHE